jgi:hypothetical protein
MTEPSDVDVADTQLITTGSHARQEIARRGFAWIPRSAWSIGPRLAPHWQRLCHDWESLEPDRYLANGATFRRRRYGRYSWRPEAQELGPLPQEAYFQPEEENGYAGGIVREFAPLLPETVHNPFLHALVCSTFACLPLSGHRQSRTWEVRIHQIRIVATPDEPGQPAPEGIHQDGTDFLTLHLVRRHNVAGAESTIYDLDRQPIERFTMREALDSMILEDPRIMHGVTPVTSDDGRNVATRDLLGVDFLYRPDLNRLVDAS